MTDMGSPCIRKYDKLTVSSLALAARATRDYMRCQERDWQALSHFSTSLTQQETAFHRSTVARRSRSRSARGVAAGMGMVPERNSSSASHSIRAGVAAVSVAPEHVYAAESQQTASGSSESAIHCQL